jgi:hypothetical protein
MDQGTLSGVANDLTSDQRVELLQALAPVAGRQVRKLELAVKMQLGGAEVEAFAGSCAGSLTSLHLDSATLHDSFWRPLAQHFPNLQELCLGRDIKAGAMSVAAYLATFSGCASQVLNASIHCLRQEDAARLRSFVVTRRLETSTCMLRRYQTPQEVTAGRSSGTGGVHSP